MQTDHAHRQASGWSRGRTPETSDPQLSCLRAATSQNSNRYEINLIYVSGIWIEAKTVTKCCLTGLNPRKWLPSTLSSWKQSVVCSDNVQAVQHDFWLSCLSVCVQLFLVACWVRKVCVCLNNEPNNCSGTSWLLCRQFRPSWVGLDGMSSGHLCLATRPPPASVL